MSIKLKSLRSSSSGNCIFVWSENTKILIDCGLSSMKRTREILREGVGDIEEIDGVLLSHMHSDHISYYPLRVLDEYGLSVFLSQSSVVQLKDNHFRGYGFKGIELNCFNGSGFEIGDLYIEPFKVSHHPSFETYGFVVLQKGVNGWKKVVIATDFNDFESVNEHFIDADMIFVESNYDYELLRQYFNPNSRYHLSNPDSARLIYQAWNDSDNKFGTVVLGHLSKQRNDGKIAVNEVHSFFREMKVKVEFKLSAAPGDVESEVFEVI